jgi:hypothetical protein
MASTYVRRFNLKSSLNDKQVSEFWQVLLGEFVPAIQKVKGVHSAKVYSGAGALRADIRLVADMDNAGVYETLIREPIGQQAACLLLWRYGPGDIDADVYPGSDSRFAEGIEFVGRDRRLYRVSRPE